MNAWRDVHYEHKVIMTLCFWNVGTHTSLFVFKMWLGVRVLRLLLVKYHMSGMNLIKKGEKRDVTLGLDLAGQAEI